MGFSTRASASWPERGPVPVFAILWIFLTVCTAACAPTDADFGIRLYDLGARLTAGGLSVTAHQAVQLSGEARRALRHGVPLRIRIDLALSGPGQWPAVGGGSFAYEIRYLPLSDHYQLSGPTADGPARTYPRLRHVLSALEDVELLVAGVTEAPGPVKVRMRSRLDRGSMPGPMQLPVLLSPQWQHDSGWTSRELELGG